MMWAHKILLSGLCEGQQSAREKEQLRPLEKNPEGSPHKPWFTRASFSQVLLPALGRLGFLILSQLHSLVTRWAPMGV